MLALIECLPHTRGEEELPGTVGGPTGPGSGAHGLCREKDKYDKKEVG